MTLGKSGTDLELATVIHDLRSPLTAILGYAQLTARTLKSDAGSTTAEYALLEIQLAARRMARMLDEVLAPGSENGDAPSGATDSTEDLGAVLDRAVRQVEQATGQPRVHLHLPAGPLACPADPARLTRAIVNVVENALKYSPDGGQVVVCASQDGRAVVIVVRDPGIGIPAAELQRIFDPYSRASNARDRFVGTGLGLASARSLVESAGGSIAVASVEGDGTTVTIRLPLPEA
jgi:signal transduction histidine kinase